MVIWNLRKQPCIRLRVATLVLIAGVAGCDNSAPSSVGIEVYVPVKDPETSRIIGVAKAVCNSNAIKAEL